MILSVILSKTVSYEHVPDSERGYQHKALWISIPIFVSEVRRRMKITKDELLVRNSDTAARIRRREDQLERTTRDLRTQTAMRLTVGFLKVYCELQYICDFCVTNLSLQIKVKIKVKWSRYRSDVAQRVGRGIALLFNDRGTRRGWVVSSTPRPQFSPGKDPVPIVQEAGWAPGLVWMGGKSRPHRDSILDRPARSQSLYWMRYPVHPIWRVIANKLNKQSRTADKGWFSSLGVGRGANNPSL